MNWKITFDEFKVQYYKKIIYLDRIDFYYAYSNMNKNIAITNI